MKAGAAAEVEQVEEHEEAQTKKPGMMLVRIIAGGSKTPQSVGSNNYGEVCSFSTGVAEDLIERKLAVPASDKDKKKILDVHFRTKALALRSLLDGDKMEKIEPPKGYKPPEGIEEEIAELEKALAEKEAKLAGRTPGGIPRR